MASEKIICFSSGELLLAEKNKPAAPPMILQFSAVQSVNVQSLASPANSAAFVMIEFTVEFLTFMLVNLELTAYPTSKLVRHWSLPVSASQFSILRFSYSKNNLFSVKFKLCFRNQ